MITGRSGCRQAGEL